MFCLTRHPPSPRRTHLQGLWQQGRKVDGLRGGRAAGPAPSGRAAWRPEHHTSGAPHAAPTAARRPVPAQDVDERRVQVLARGEEADAQRVVERDLGEHVCDCVDVDGTEEVRDDRRHGLRERVHADAPFARKGRVEERGLRRGAGGSRGRGQE